LAVVIGEDVSARAGAGTAEQTPVVVGIRAEHGTSEDVVGLVGLLGVSSSSTAEANIVGPDHRGTEHAGTAGSVASSCKYVAAPLWAEQIVVVQTVVLGVWLARAEAKVRVAPEQAASKGVVVEDVVLRLPVRTERVVGRRTQLLIVSGRGGIRAVLKEVVSGSGLPEWLLVLTEGIRPPESVLLLVRSTLLRWG